MSPEAYAENMNLRFVDTRLRYIIGYREANAASSYTEIAGGFRGGCGARSRKRRHSGGAHGSVGQCPEAR